MSLAGGHAMADRFRQSIVPVPRIQMPRSADMDIAPGRERRHGLVMGSPVGRRHIASNH